MRIKYTSVFVGDQAKALDFYTEILGFVKKQDLAIGQFRWLTVVSPEDPEGTELLLEPNDNPVSKTYQKGIFTQSIPAALFSVDDVEASYRRLMSLKVTFTRPPTRVNDVTVAVFDDTCGNLIQIVQTQP